MTVHFLSFFFNWSHFCDFLFDFLYIIIHLKKEGIKFSEANSFLLQTINIVKGGKYIFDSVTSLTSVSIPLKCVPPLCVCFPGSQNNQDKTSDVFYCITPYDHVMSIVFQHSVQLTLGVLNCYIEHAWITKFFDNDYVLTTFFFSFKNWLCPDKKKSYLGSISKLFHTGQD